MPTNQLTKVEENQNWMPSANVFGDLRSYEYVQRLAKMFSQSEFVPEKFKGPANIANCVVATGIAVRMGIDPLMVMQNLQIIQGNPGWKSRFLIATINASPQFDKLRFEWDEKPGKDVKYTIWKKDPKTGKSSPVNGSVKLDKIMLCRAWAVDKETKQKVFGEWISNEMAVLEGWWTKNNSKWPTMQGQMCMYRAASFFSAVHCPEIGLGIKTVEEIQDADFEVLESKTFGGDLSDLNGLIDGEDATGGETPVTGGETVEEWENGEAPNDENDIV